MERKTTRHHPEKENDIKNLNKRDLGYLNKQDLDHPSKIDRLLLIKKINSLEDR